MMGSIRDHAAAIYVCPVCEHMRLSEHANVESDEDCYRGSNVICNKRRVTKRMQTLWAMHFVRRTKESDDLATDTKIRVKSIDATLYLCDSCATRYHRQQTLGIDDEWYEAKEEDPEAPQLPNCKGGKEVSIYQVYGHGIHGGYGVPH
jgi:hypothetical protein